MKKVIILFFLLVSTLSFSQSMKFIEKYNPMDGDKWSCQANCYINTRGWKTNRQHHYRLIVSTGKTAASAMEHLKWRCNFQSNKLSFVDGYREHGIVTARAKTIYGKSRTFSGSDNHHSIDQFSPEITKDCVKNQP